MSATAFSARLCGQEAPRSRLHDATERTRVGAGAPQTHTVTPSSAPRKTRRGRRLSCKRTATVPAVARTAEEVTGCFFVALQPSAPSWCFACTKHAK